MKKYDAIIDGQVVVVKSYETAALSPKEKNQRKLIRAAIKRANGEVVKPVITHKPKWLLIKQNEARLEQKFGFSFKTKKKRNRRKK